ncbi:MAG: tRNA-dihydrouridine synthase family protein [Oscillospiraceae bacterium]|nr:tRNA-dihydrouridine synthase family protein [Oscillospiraceae bacterium]
MQYYFAPLEGLTDSIYRRLHRQFFPGADRYYTPFFSPTVHRSLTPREARELPPADAIGCSVIPQLLTKVPEDFLFMAGVCKDLGYTEVNLNTGCPSGTVTAKGKGSGMLRDLNTLDAFLDNVFSHAPLPISVKTRIGFADSEEFPKILEVFNRYPIRELTIHPRVRTAFYKGSVDMSAFRYAAETAKMPLCYNGNLCTLRQIAELQAEFPAINAVMIGRGLIADPGLLTPGGTTPDTLKAFHDTLLETYIQEFGGSRNAMFRLKENWRHWLCKFQGSEHLGKRLRKTTDVDEYRAISEEIFRTLPLRSETLPDWD